MDSFTTWMLKGLHAKQEKSRLSQISNMIDWTPFRQILEKMYDNKSEKGGRPNCDVILMFKILILQKWYGLSDLEVERQMADRISFMAFLDFPDPFPDSRTIWLFKQRIVESGKYDLVWAELQRQLDAMGLHVKRGTMQDATFIEADPGSSKKPRGEVSLTKVSGSFDVVETMLKLDAVEMEPGRRKETRLILAISCTKKTDIDYCLIREIETTTASLHDSQVDLSTKDEIVLRDKGYFGAEAKGIDFTMKRRTSEKPLEELDKERNRLISILRSPGERPHAVIKRVFRMGRVLVTTVKRVHVVKGGVKLSNYGGIKLTTYHKNLLHVWTFFPVHLEKFWGINPCLFRSLMR